MSCVICGHWNCDAHVGYKGQKYEVRFTELGRVRVYGWTDDPTGGTLVESINAHPTWKDPVVIEVERRTT